MNASVDLNIVKVLADRYSPLPVGYSGHERDILPTVASVGLGARTVERHFTLDSKMRGSDHHMSIEPSEFKEMVNVVRVIEKAIGTVKYGGVKGEVRIMRRSLFVIKNMKKGDTFIEGENVRSIRPGNGLHTRYLEEVVGKKASTDIEEGTPLNWDLVSN